MNNRFRGNDSVVRILEPVLGKRAKLAGEELRTYRIETINQFMGSLKPYIPVSTTKDIRKRQMSCSVVTLRRVKSPEHAISKMRRTLKISSTEASHILGLFENVEKTYQVYDLNFNFGFGAKKKCKTNTKLSSATRIRGSFYRSNGSYVVPNYGDMGSVFDQGNRGTCVANSIVSLLNYKAKSDYSRQFIYHQAKCTDGLINEEGTYVDIAFKTLMRNSYKDHGCVHESIWKYNPDKSHTEHQGPPPEMAYFSRRVTIDGYIELNLNSLVKEILYYLKQSQPLVIGLAIYESWFSKETTRTGLVTDPLPGEELLGYHAMLVVGYDEKRRIFIVRNSWATSWAAENDLGYPGHALISYEYMEQCCFTAITVKNVQESHVIVEPEDRLYNTYLNVEYASGRKAAMQQFQKIKHRRVNEKHKIPKQMKSEKIRAGKSREGISWFYKIAVLVLIFMTFRSQIQTVVNRLLIAAKAIIPIEEIGEKVSDLINNQ